MSLHQTKPEKSSGNSSKKNTEEQRVVSKENLAAQRKIIQYFLKEPKELPSSKSEGEEELQINRKNVSEESKEQSGLVQYKQEGKAHIPIGDITPTVVPSKRNTRALQMKEEEDEIRQNKPAGMSKTTYQKLKSPEESSKMVAQAKFSEFKKSKLKQFKKDKKSKTQFNSIANNFERTLIQGKIAYGSEEYNNLLGEYFPNFAKGIKNEVNQSTPAQLKTDKSVSRILSDNTTIEGGLTAENNDPEELPESYLRDEFQNDNIDNEPSQTDFNVAGYTKTDIISVDLNPYTGNGREAERQPTEKIQDAIIKLKSSSSKVWMIDVTLIIQEGGIDTIKKAWMKAENVELLILHESVEKTQSLDIDQLSQNSVKWFYKGNDVNKKDELASYFSGENQYQGTNQVSIQEKAISSKGKHNKTGMPDNLKAGIENLSGIDMGDVKVHKNSSKPKGVGAHAYTKGTDIHLAPGQEKHLPHEAWHAIQQKQGRVQPTEQLKGENINSDEGLEKEADVMGGEALQKMNIKDSVDDNSVNRNDVSVIQLGKQKKNGKNKKPETKGESNIVNLLKEVFKEDEIKIAGPGGKGADIIANDPYNLWIIEDKGGGNSLKNTGKKKKGGRKKSNLVHKQIFDALGSKINKKFETNKDGQEVEDYIFNDLEGYKRLLLATTGLPKKEKKNPSLLGVKFLGDKLQRKETDYSLIKLEEVFKFIANKGTCAEKLEHDWKESDKGIREWMQEDQNSVILADGYTNALKDNAHVGFFKKLKENEEIRLLPIVDFNKIKSKLGDEHLQKKAIVSTENQQNTVVQLQKFENEEGAEKWLIDQFKKTQPPIDTKLGKNITFYLKDRIQSDKKYSSDIKENLVFVKRIFFRARKKYLKQKKNQKNVTGNEISSDQRIHILEGVIANDKIVGGHHKPSLNKDFVVKNEGKKDSFGCYKGDIQSKNKKKIKPKIQSSFFPDDWTSGDIINAIKTAARVGQKYEVTCEKGKGMKLFYNKESWFPYMQ